MMIKWLHARKRKKYEININDRCLQCGYCLKICPLIFHWASESEKGRFVSVRSKVLQNALIRCEAGCPAGAISVREMKQDPEG